MKNSIAVTLLIVSGMFFTLSKSTAYASDPGMDRFAGKMICREAQGPEDTTAFRIELLKNGEVRGAGSFSGASANYSLTSGKWELRGDFLEISLFFSGDSYGKGKKTAGGKTVKIKILKSDLINSKSGCFDFTDPL